MRCDLCKKRKASVHVTQDPMPGKIIRVDLCSACAKRYGIGDPTNMALDDLLRALGKKITTPDSP